VLSTPVRGDLEGDGDLTIDEGDVGEEAGDVGDVGDDDDDVYDDDEEEEDLNFTGCNLVTSPEMDVTRTPRTPLRKHTPFTYYSSSTSGDGSSTSSADESKLEASVEILAGPPGVVPPSPDSPAAPSPAAPSPAAPLEPQDL
jgi:hypothetical protein